MTRTRPPEFVVDYDRDADVLYVSLGRPVPALAVGDDSDVRISWQYTFDTHQLVGVTVWGYREGDIEALSRLIQERFAHEQHVQSPLVLPMV